MLAISSSLRHGFINGFVHWGLPFGGFSLRDKEAAAMGDEKTTSPNGRGSGILFFGAGFVYYARKVRHP